MFFFFFLSALFSGVLGWGASSPGQGIFTPPGVRGQAAQGEGHTPGYLHSGGETNCTKAASLPVWGGGRGKLPRIQDKSVHRLGCLFVYIVAWYTRGYTYIFTSLFWERDYHSAHLFIKIVYMYFKARLSMCARHFSFRYGGWVSMKTPCLLIAF